MKPYLRTLGKVGKFTIWEFDGNWARTNMDIELDNFEEHFLFPKIIPKYEIWIDKGVDPKELKVFIARAIFEWALYTKKHSKDQVYTLANEFERKFREGFGLMNDKVIPEKAKLELFHTTRDGIQVWIVDGAYVRQPPGGNMNFAGAAHWLVPEDNYIPENEVWIDQQISPQERTFVAIHELSENLIMRGAKLGYEEAHTHFATPIELAARRFPDKMATILKALKW